MQKFLILSFGWLCLPVFAHANFLINPAGGEALWDSYSGRKDDEVITGRSLGFTGHYFGLSKTTVDVSINGNLNFSGAGNYTNTPMPSNVARISPLWDDWLIQPGDLAQIVEKKFSGIYTMTWLGIESYPGSSGKGYFQVIWFGLATTLNGYNFEPDDIVFDYEAIDTPFLDNSATVGLDKGDGVASAPLPGSSNGVITSAQTNQLPDNTGFVLFRPDGNGNYTVSVVPEPSSYLLAIIGLTAGCIARRRFLTNKQLSA